MDLTPDEKRFLRILAAGRVYLFTADTLRLEQLQEEGLLRRVGPKPLDVVLTGAGRKLAEQL
ncbi:MAG: hypothetical protein RDA78_19440 [Roseibium sp.]|uniref:hypothetical protein n=1 Tax=Roseibium sp. TaxID=1936156 RepID=UPI003D9C22F8